MSDRCPESHEYIKESFCVECGDFVDKYGNTEAEFRFCCFPDCGCDGARLCMAPSGANNSSMAWNIESRHD